MKKIDMHSHVGKFGGWAGFDSDIDTLIKFMDEYEVEKNSSLLCLSKYKRRYSCGF